MGFNSAFKGLTASRVNVKLYMLSRQLEAKYTFIAFLHNSETAVRLAEGVRDFLFYRAFRPALGSLTLLING